MIKKSPRGIRHEMLKLDFSLYSVDGPVRGVSGAALSMIDLWPQAVERAIMFVHGYGGCAETWEYQINHFAND